MRIIICYGNSLRGDDGFGLDVGKILKSKNLQNTKIIILHQLVPELTLDLLYAKELVFVDASYSNENSYKLACDIANLQNNNQLSHHISYRQILAILNDVYNIYPKYEVFSMLCNNFDEVVDMDLYMECVMKCAEYLD
ncbi:hypothetical protein [Arcobacter sp. FWKO B]|uniref:hypothetical protein n=1 Tax=Arcobacter sp. FWKO B TaxID=2593672 RepID=UPI0018A33CEA|nr:hypothetical protein [Arcobacter sp. FWKO B]QOG13111.1 hypothetical protein FWKOB_10620 [Arcobacter sp. FWKO B]